MANKKKMGRPKRYSPEEAEIIIEKFNKYIDENDLPIVCEFAYQNNVNRDALYYNPEFSTVLKKCTTKKEAQLEKLAAFNVINSSMAIFSLKQLGWSDKQEIDLGNKEIEAFKVKRE